MNQRRFAGWIPILIASLLVSEVVAAAPSAGVPRRSGDLDNRGTYPGTPTHGTLNRRVANQGTHTQVLTGREALDHLKYVQARRAKEFAEASRLLIAKGWQPTERVVVARTVRDSVARNNDTEPMRPAQTIETDEGEVIFWSWDDGNSLTWEGQVWAQRFSDQAESLTAPQADTQQNRVITEETIYWNRPYLEKDKRVRNGITRSGISLASFRDPSIQRVVGTWQHQMMMDWLACVFEMCAGGLVGCAFSGPFYVECAVLVCASAITICALGEIIRRL